MSQKFKTLGILFIAAQFLVGCSSTYRAPESFDEKIARYRPQTHSRNQTPELPSFTPKMGHQGRAPASVPSLNEAPFVAPEQEFVQSHSPKKLYFLTLYTQYQKLSELKQIPSKAPEVCPHFHSSLVKHREYFSQSSRPEATVTKNYTKELIQSLKNSPEKLAYYPELALPVQSDSLRPRVIDLINHDSDVYTPLVTKHMVDEAISVHLDKTHSELAELCEFGSSDNYYIYENLVDKIEREGAFKPDSMGAQTMMKTGPVFNHALINSLVGPKTGPTRSPASAQKNAQELYHREALQRLEAGWMRSYFSELGRD